MLALLLYLWLAWVVGNFVLILVSPYIFFKNSPARTNGLWIVVHEKTSDLLDPDEFEAVIAHERGHIARLHVWKNFALACFFILRSREALEWQELEADDYAVTQFDPLSLASALRRLGTSPFDLYREERLESMLADAPNRELV